MADTQPPPVPAHEIAAQPAELPKLRSNYGRHVDSAFVGWMRPTPASTSMDEMRRLYETEGYVWVKNLLPREDVYDLREQ